MLRTNNHLLQLNSFINSMHSAVGNKILKSSVKSKTIAAEIGNYVPI
jgi:hypothetical protein